MERAEARHLQPHDIESFFLEAFQRLGGTVRQWCGVAAGSERVGAITLDVSHRE